MTQSLFNIDKTMPARRPTGSTRSTATCACAATSSAWPATSPNKWQVFGGYTYMDGTVLKALDGTTGQDAREHAAQHDHVVDDLRRSRRTGTFGGGPVYMSARYAANNDFVQVRGYTRWDAMAAFHQKKYDIQFNVLEPDRQELLRCADSIGWRPRGAGLGRTFLATLNYRFY